MSVQEFYKDSFHWLLKLFKGRTMQKIPGGRGSIYKKDKEALMNRPDALAG